jgi:hypothetical protein
MQLNLFTKQPRPFDLLRQYDLLFFNEILFYLAPIRTGPGAINNKK